MVDISRYQQNAITEQQEFWHGDDHHGVKLDDATRERIKTAATRIDRTPHWLIKQAILTIWKDWRVKKVCRSCLPCWRAQRTKAKKPRRPLRRTTSRSSNLPSRSCRSPSAAPPLPAPTAVPKPTPCRCCWSRRACRKPLPLRRTARRISSPTSCVIRKPPADALVWCRVCCRSSPLLAGRRGADVSGGSAAAYSG